MEEERTSLRFRQVNIQLVMLGNGQACQVHDDFNLTTNNHWCSSFLVRSNHLSRNHDRNHKLQNSKSTHCIRHLFHILVPKTYLHNINVFILSGQFLFFLSIELDDVMETDNELEQKHKLDEVRFSIRNCKTETMSSD